MNYLVAKTKDRKKKRRDWLFLLSSGGAANGFQLIVNSWSGIRRCDEREKTKRIWINWNQLKSGEQQRAEAQFRVVEMELLRPIIVDWTALTNPSEIERRRRGISLCRCWPTDPDWPPSGNRIIASSSRRFLWFLSHRQIYRPAAGAERERARRAQTQIPCGIRLNTPVF